MNDNENKILFDKYMEMPEEELIKMLVVDESEYREGVFPTLIEAAKSRGLGTNKDEIIKKATSAQRELEQKVADQALNRQKKILIMGIILLAIGFAGGNYPGSNLVGHELSPVLGDLVYTSEVAGKILIAVWFAKWFVKKLSKPKE